MRCVNKRSAGLQPSIIQCVPIVRSAYIYRGKSLAYNRHGMQGFDTIGPAKNLIMYLSVSLQSGMNFMAGAAAGPEKCKSALSTRFKRPISYLGPVLIQRSSPAIPNLHTTHVRGIWSGSRGEEANRKKGASGNKGGEWNDDADEGRQADLLLRDR